jgi:hypothetical protein
MVQHISHYTNHHKDFFTVSPSTTDEFVIDDIKPAYSLFMDSMNIDIQYMNNYLNGSAFKTNYDIAKKLVTQYVYDVYHKTSLSFVSKTPLAIYVATYKKNRYVIKGEFILRVINDFILKKINIADLTYDKFMSFVADNTPYWTDSIIDIEDTTLNLSKTSPMSDYLFLLDRYETYDEEFINNIKSAVDVFLF